MKRLLIAIIVVAAAWAGYWVWASQTVKSELEGWFADRRAEGWIADYADLSVEGFPNRVDSSFTNLRLADTGSGWAWEAPFFQLMTLTYQPNHIIAVWPNAQLLATPDQKLDITSAKLQASLVLDAGGALPLNRTNLVADTLTIQTRDGQATTMAALRAAIQKLEGTDNTYRFAIQADDFAPPMAWRGMLGATELPRTFSALQAQVEVSFDDRWDISSIESRRPQPTHIDLKLAEAKWGELELWIAGAAEIDDLGRLNGDVTIKARNWREIIEMGVASGSVPRKLGDQLKDTLGLLAGLAGNPKTLDIPLELRKSTIFMGPVPVGKIPRMQLR